MIDDSKLPVETIKRITYQRYISGEGDPDDDYLCGAYNEATRALKLVEALEKFISMHETGLLPDRVTYETSKKVLEEYKKS